MVALLAVPWAGGIQSNKTQEKTMNLSQEAKKFWEENYQFAIQQLGTYLNRVFPLRGADWRCKVLWENYAVILNIVLLMVAEHFGERVRDLYEDPDFWKEFRAKREEMIIRVTALRGSGDLIYPETGEKFPVHDVTQPMNEVIGIEVPLELLKADPDDERNVEGLERYLQAGSYNKRHWKKENEGNIATIDPHMSKYKTPTSILVVDLSGEAPDT